MDGPGCFESHRLQVGQGDFINKYRMIFNLAVLGVMVRYPQHMNPRCLEKKKRGKDIVSMVSVDPLLF